MKAFLLQKTCYNILIGVCFLFLNTVNSQWTNRYPKAQRGHHVYFEGFEMPGLNVGITDPTPSPLDSDLLVCAAKGWLWMVDISTRSAKRITFTNSVDARPNWSSDGTHLVFVRDTDSDTKIILLELSTLTETELVDTAKIDLDPIFSEDNRFVYYSSAEKGTMDIWKINLATKQKSVVLETSSLERLPIVFDNQGQMLVLSKKNFSTDALFLKNLKTGESSTVLEENFTSQLSYSLGPDQETLVYCWPSEDDYEIRLKDINQPYTSLLLTKGEGLPLSPKISRDNRWVYFSENNKKQVSKLKRILLTGGEPETLQIKSWDWGKQVHKFTVNTTVNGIQIPARISITDENGHPIVPDANAIHFDGQNGLVFYYANAGASYETETNKVRIKATHGFSTYLFEKTFDLNELEGNTIDIALKKIWAPENAQWYSADNHFHLNYGGTYKLKPKDIQWELHGEDLDISFPLLANLHYKFLERDLWRYTTAGYKKESPLIIFGQEVRSHFLGHIGLLGSKKLFWPWVWGPRYEVYGSNDRTNAEAIKFSTKNSGVTGYVHPVTSRTPFTERGAQSIPVELIADYVLGYPDILEIGCLWSDEIGTANLWHEFLNLGNPIAISAGSDVMNDYYRTMAIGSARVFVKIKDVVTEESYLNALKKGQSFVTTGPLIEFTVDGQEPGGIIQNKSKVKWHLKTHSADPITSIELFVNGDVVWRSQKKTTAGNHEFSGVLKLPKAGWVTARINGAETTRWPSMDSYGFAETGAIWISEIGSIDLDNQKAAAEKLLKNLRVSRTRLIKGYDGEEIPKLTAHFDKAEQKLKAILEN